jgi:hypothetical protein
VRRYSARRTRKSEASKCTARSFPACVDHVDCRLATTRQWELEKSKRQAVEKAKQDELLAARTDLAKWQQHTDAQDSATESEEDEVEDMNRPMPDHEDYHGKGWRSDR